MADIQTIWDPPNSRGDWLVSGGALASDDDLTTALIISLFTDRRADIGDVIPDGTGDRRGWWGDNRPDGTLDVIGSRLWLLDRRKQDQKTLNDAVTYAKEALQWLISDGVASKVDVQASWNGRGFLGMLVTVTLSNGTVMSERFEAAPPGAATAMPSMPDDAYTTESGDIYVTVAGDYYATESIPPLPADAYTTEGGDAYVTADGDNYVTEN